MPKWLQQPQASHATQQCPEEEGPALPCLSFPLEHGNLPLKHSQQSPILGPFHAAVGSGLPSVSH
jgi:hypothetical protein